MKNNYLQPLAILDSNDRKAALDQMKIYLISQFMTNNMMSLGQLSKQFQHKIVIVFLSISLNMFCVLKRIFFLILNQNICLIPTTYVLVEN